MNLPECPKCQSTEHVSVFTRSEPISEPGHPTLQWVAYICSRCKTSHVRLEPVAEEN